MVTRITRLLIVLQLFVAMAIAAWAIYAWGAGSALPALLIGLGIVVLVRLLIVANNFFITWRYRSELPDALKLGWIQTGRLFLEEFRASMISSSWTMAFHRFSKRAAKNPVGLPVLLIHGYGCNSGYWHSMSKALSRAQITHFAIDLEPVFLEIDGYVSSIRDAVEALCAETGHDKIIIVAHSMGGLATRTYLRDHGSQRIAKVITIGTPHQGTVLANFGAGPNSRQMSWAGDAKSGTPSEWLRTLAQSETDAVRALFVSIYSHHDNIVSPQSSSHLAGADNIEFHAIGHVALGCHPLVQQRVVDEVLATRPCSSAAPVLKSA